jgi:site-specific recombinase XerD
MILEDLFRRPDELARFRMPPLGSQMDGFCDWLSRQGFSQEATRRRARQASHFNRYLRRRGIKEGQNVETELAERFVVKHLPHCRCEGFGEGINAGRPSYVRSFIEYLSGRGFVVFSPQPSPPYQQLLQEYLDYLKCERNLEECTIKRHQWYLTPFLEELGNALTKRLHELTPTQVLAFSAKCEKDRGQTIRQGLQGVLRSFLRFCLQQGYLDRDLAQALPKIHTYKLSGVPRDISEEDAQKTLESIDRTTPSGKRDFAILQLLHTYGVRGGQVRALRLEEIHWTENQIHFMAHKGGKELIEPLFDDVGESLLDYLRFGRPKAPYPEVFLTTQPPFRPLRSPAAISSMVSRRMCQAGVSRPKAGSNVFRHGFATRMLQQGQSLKTIADLLGHRNINTTFIYTKVDLKILEQLPLDWPEV